MKLIERQVRAKKIVHFFSKIANFEFIDKSENAPTCSHAGTIGVFWVASKDHIQRGLVYSKVCVDS